MEIIEARSMTAPPEIITGPTMVLVNRNLRTETVEDERGESRTECVYTQYRLESGEYDLIHAGILPDGAAWDAELRRIERSAKLDAADIDIAKAEDYIASGEDWSERLKALRAYKMAVRATKTQPGFPAEVDYPEYPGL